MPSLDFLNFFSRDSHEKTGEISHSHSPCKGENEKKSLTARTVEEINHPRQLGNLPPMNPTGDPFEVFKALGLSDAFEIFGLSRPDEHRDEPNTRDSSHLDGNGATGEPSTRRLTRSPSKEHPSESNSLHDQII
ncbi:MAG: hypothetical protein C5B58_07305 [Acidobacteria bacterium]|nr:MAG: hypothetical protein C5B58_07305 [Acidobacteriota bacterium]